MDLVSIVVPMYNAEHYISETIESILNQSYTNFEVLCVDDISNDNTINIVKKHIEQDNRIKLFILPEKGGASLARNLAIRESKGKYIAFLDADDVWHPLKLEKQIKFMKENDYKFTYTNYGFIDTDSSILEKISNSPKISTLSSLQKKNRIGCLTVIYDNEHIGLIQIPKLDKRNDYALWLKVLRKVESGYLLDEILSYYRVDPNSLSRKDGKINLIKYHYQLHRKIQEYGIFKSIYYTTLNIIFNLF